MSKIQTFNFKLILITLYSFFSSHSFADDYVQNFNRQLSSTHLILHTGKGDLIFELFQDVAPLTTDVIEKITNAGIYSGTGFFKVSKNYYAQTSPIIDRNIPLTPEQNELISSISSHYILETNSIENLENFLTIPKNGFFRDFSLIVLLRDSKNLDRDFLVIGKLISGRKVLEKMAKVPQKKLEYPDVRININSAEIAKNLTVSEIQNRLSRTTTYTKLDFIFFYKTFMVATFIGLFIFYLNFKNSKLSPLAFFSRERWGKYLPIKLLKLLAIAIYLYGIIYWNAMPFFDNIYSKLDNKLGVTFFDKIRISSWWYPRLVGLDHKYQMFNTVARYNHEYRFYGIDSNSKKFIYPIEFQSKRSFLEENFFDHRRAKFHLNIWTNEFARKAYSNYLCRKYTDLFEIPLKTTGIDWVWRNINDRQTAIEQNGILSKKNNFYKSEVFQCGN